MFDGEKEKFVVFSKDTGKKAVQKFVSSILERSKLILDKTVNGKDIQMFERILKEIADLPNFYRDKFDQNESYYPKLLEIFEVENEIQLVLTRIGVSYTVEGCKDVSFTRLELEKIGERFTHIKLDGDI